MKKQIESVQLSAYLFELLTTIELTDYSELDRLMNYSAKRSYGCMEFEKVDYNKPIVLTT